MSWKMIIILAVIAGGTLGGLSLHERGSSTPAPPSPHPTSAPAAPTSAAPTGAAVRFSDASGTVTTVCAADGTPINVRPDTPAARTTARTLCASASNDQRIVQSRINAIGD